MVNCAMIQNKAFYEVSGNSWKHLEHPEIAGNVPRGRQINQGGNFSELYLWKYFPSFLSTVLYNTIARVLFVPSATVFVFSFP